MRFKSIILSLFLFIPLYSLVAQPRIQYTKKGIELSNDRAIIILSDNAQLVSCIDVKTGIDIAAKSRKAIARAITKDGKSIDANKLSLTGNNLHIYFGRHEVQCQVEAVDAYFTFEVIGGSLEQFESIVFLDLRMNYDFASDNPFIAAGVAMTLQTNPLLFPSGESKEVIGQCNAHTGLRGAKIAFVVCRKDDLRELLQKVYASIPRGTIPISRAGGPFAQDSYANKSDCLILRDVNPSRIENSIEFYNRFGIRQLDFQQGQQTFIQGEFSFPGVGSAKAFKQKVTDPLHKAGILSTLHTYSYYISYQATEILSNPRWQKQLEFYETLLLSKKLSTSSTTIELRGDKSSLSNSSTFKSFHTPFVLVDNEIIRYTLENGKLVSCQRGQCGTVATDHKAGTVVRFLGGYYGSIAPQPGSELFYEVARRTATAYNEGGFDGLYFDAIDGLPIHLKHAGLGDYQWYYGSAFVNEVLKSCNGNPTVEYSTLYPSIWAARGRGGAWDTPNRGFKNFIDDHTESNKAQIDRMYVPSLGWWNFYPQQKAQPGNFATKYMYFDDIDYLGVKSIAYDQTMVYSGLKESDISSVPALRRNMEEYSQYSLLRTDGYFSDKVKSVLRTGKYEYKLVKKGGRWVFQEVLYCRSKIRDLNSGQLMSTNPFHQQKPFIRLENMYSSDCKSTIPLLQFDDAVDFSAQTCKNRFNTPLNLSNHLAIRVIIKGNGSSSNDAICVRLRSSDTSGYSDYIVRTGFEGWKEVILADLDNAECSDLIFQGLEDDNYKMHRQSIDYAKVESVQVYKSGDCRGVRIKSIAAVPLVKNALAYPVVHIGTSSVFFKDVLDSGEYLEYWASEGQARIYDSAGSSRTVEVERQGRFNVPKGRFKAMVTGDAELKNAPSQVVLTVGVYGQFVGN